MAAKKKSKKKAAKKTVKKKKAAARKKAVKKKKAAKKKAAPKKKKAATKKKAARKKAATKRPSADEAEAEAAEPEEESDGDLGELTRGRRRAMAPREEGAEEAQTARRPRRRRGSRIRERAPTPPEGIPPLPDEEEDYIPFEDDPAPSEEAGADTGLPGREMPAGTSPEEALDLVRKGELHISVLADLPERDIRALARSAGVRYRSGERRNEVVYRLVNQKPKRVVESQHVEGLLELHPDGYGFLRRKERSYSQHPADVYVAAGLIRRLQLQPGHWITGTAHQPRPNQPQLALQTVDEVNHEDPSAVQDITPFDKLTVIYPDTQLILETTQEDVEMRVMDLFCPLGRGQRGLIVAPPRTGKTVMLTKIADAIAANSPDVDIVVLLIDERPEEVTNMSRSVRGEVIASTFDKPASNHIRVAELVMEKVKRMVEMGRHVVLLLDSITRMGRAYNNATGGSGRILTGGLDAKALTKPKRFFGSARNVEGGGSLTIVATALVDTGSAMDQVIFEEFKGTGNMEVVLSRELANARVWPAIDVPASGTRNEDLLLHPDMLRRVVLLRRGITGQDPQAVMLALRDQMSKFPTNAEFLMQLGN